jgi:hypothetical protein
MLTKDQLKGDIVPFWISAALADGMQFNRLMKSDCKAKDRPSVTIELSSYSADSCAMHFELMINNGRFFNPSKRAASPPDQLWFAEGATTRIQYLWTNFKEALFDYNQIEMRAGVLNADHMQEEDSECTDS